MLPSGVGLSQEAYIPYPFHFAGRISIFVAVIAQVRIPTPTVDALSFACHFSLGGVRAVEAEIPPSAAVPVGGCQSQGAPLMHVIAHRVVWYPCPPTILLE